MIAHAGITPIEAQNEGVAEDCPAPFHARFGRSPRSIRRSARPRHHYGRRLSALAAAIAVPAFAAPGDWQSLHPANLAVQAGESDIAPMPFEQPGSGFPGSAFYYLEDTPKVSAGNGLSTVIDAINPFSTQGEEDEDNALVQVREVGPAAHSFRFGGTGLDRMRAQQCLSMAVYYEAASESLDGQRAVAQVVLNRVAHPSYPNSVCGVVFQGSERVTGCQFSFTCDGSLRRKPSIGGMARANMVARDALAGAVYSPVGLATHYHTVWINPYWASSLDMIGTIGAHRFYRWRGAAGKSGAFSSAYRGGEPAAAPHPRSVITESAAATDPLALAREFEAAQKAAATSYGSSTSALRPSAPMPPPAYNAAIEARGGDNLFKAENLPSSGTVKPEYANSGRWISSPGSISRDGDEKSVNAH